MTKKIIYSFIVDGGKNFAYQAILLANSLIKFSGAVPADINIQFTDTVGDNIREIFRKRGFCCHEIKRFGDGKYCNKLAQIDNLIGKDCDLITLLDTDVICISDYRKYADFDNFVAKVVDCANPSLATLHEIYQNEDLPPDDIIMVDASNDLTFRTNCNGGFYSIPINHAKEFSHLWQYYASKLLNGCDVLEAEGKTGHIDQISASMAVSHMKIGFKNAASNLNYYCHFLGEHNYFDKNMPIIFVHYHNSSMNNDGKITINDGMKDHEKQALITANEFILDIQRNDLMISELNGYLENNALSVSNADLCVEANTHFIFAYWDGEDIEHLKDFTTQWCQVSGSFKLFNNDEVKKLLNIYLPDSIEIFDKINIPAAKSDFARLVLLYHYGGMYIDCHFGYTNQNEVSELFKLLDDCEGVIIERALRYGGRAEDEYFFINGVLLFNKKSKFVHMLLLKAYHNFKYQYAVEELFGYVPYHVGFLSGPSLLTDFVCKILTNCTVLREDFADKLKTIKEENLPMSRNTLRNYGNSENHWSSRQNKELLFKHE